MGFDFGRDVVGQNADGSSSWGFQNAGQFIGALFDPLGIFGGKTIAGTRGLSSIMGGTPQQVDPNAPGGSLDMGGPVIAGGMMFLHSGYGGSAGPSNLLLALTLDGK